MFGGNGDRARNRCYSSLAEIFARYTWNTHTCKPFVDTVENQ